MTDTPINARPVQAELRLGHIFSGAWDIFTANFGKFIIITAIAVIPNLFLQFGVDNSAAEPSLESALTVLLSIVFSLLLNTVGFAVIIHIAFQYLRGQPASLADALPKGLARMFPLIGAALLLSLGVVLGTLLLIIPGIMLAIRWFLAMPVCVLERAGPVASLRRSAELTKGHRWGLFGIFVVVLVVNGVIGALVGLLVSSAGLMVGVLAQFVWAAIWTAYFDSVWVMMYHDLRVAKEGVSADQIAAVFD
jgi:glycerophosphoryl diester phosphodiesterase family protein